MRSRAGPRRVSLPPLLRTAAVAVLLLSLLALCTVSHPATAAGKEDEDYYTVLGLGEAGEDASERDIKSAWRRLSKKHHPDLAAAAGGDAEAARERYQRIQRAYEVLGDRRTRKVYDILGHDGLAKLEAQRNNPNGGGGGIPHPFMHLFGGGGGGGDRGPDVEMVLEVPLEDLYAGAAHTARFERTNICRHCRGSGARSAADVVDCPHCGGTGRVVRRVQLAPGFVQQVQQPCPRCGGDGRHVAAACPHCHGHRTVAGTASLSIDLEAGTPDGAVLTYELDADQQPGQVPGDVRVTVVSAPHPVFTRGGGGGGDNDNGGVSGASPRPTRDDLSTTVQLSLREALLGFRRHLRHLDNHTVVLTPGGGHRGPSRDGGGGGGEEDEGDEEEQEEGGQGGREAAAEEAVTAHGSVVRVAGEGMPRQHVPSEHGDLYVTYEVRLPDSVAAWSEDDRRLWAEAFSSYQ